MLTRVAIAVVTVTLAAGCGSDSKGNASSTSSPSSPAPSSASAAAVDGDLTSFCAGFADLDSRRDPSVRVQTKDMAGWELDVDSVKQIAAAAPAAQLDNANAYVTMMQEREGLAAMYDYGEVPTDAQQAFGASHAALQSQVNDLIAYAKTVCQGLR